MKYCPILMLTLLTTVAPALAQQKAKRLPGTLQGFGPVHTIREEEASFTNNDGQSIEGPRSLLMTVTYNEDGTRLERTMYHGAQTSKTLEIYDINNRPRERQQFDSRGSLMMKTVYTYDDLGHLLEGVSYRGDGSLASRSLYRRNGKNEQIETISYDVHGAVIRTSTVKIDQDKRGLKSDTLTVDSRGSLAIQTSLTRQPDGTTQEYKQSGPEATFRHETLVAEKDGHSERVDYNQDGTVLKRYRFDRELDGFGNIVKITTSVAIGDSTDFNPTSIRYRTFTYYGADQQEVKQ